MQSKSRSTAGSSKRLEGEVAVISGGSSGIGIATALLFAKEGAKVAIQYSGLTSASKEKALGALKRIEEIGQEAMVVQANVSSQSDVDRAINSVVDRFKSLSLAVCFAGLPGTVESWNEDSLRLSDEKLESALKVDFLGSYHFINACKDQMKKRNYGKMVLISSTPAIYGEDTGYRFALAKGLNRLTVKSLSTKLMREYGVYLNAIAPGTVDTPANRKNYTDQQWMKLVSDIPLGRAGSPDEIAEVALFLCSHDSDYVVGQTIVVDGGEFRL